MTSEDKQTKKDIKLYVSEAEFETLITALDDSTYWRSSPKYRRDGFAHEPFDDEDEEAATGCAAADALKYKLQGQRRKHGP
jgi:hypothetical protein